jgi:hypothetical protein
LEARYSSEQSRSAHQLENYNVSKTAAPQVELRSDDLTTAAIRLGEIEISSELPLATQVAPLLFGGMMQKLSRKATKATALVKRILGGFVVAFCSVPIQLR